MAGSTQICNGWFKNVASTPYFVALEQQISRFSLWNLTREGIPSQGLDGSLTSTRITQAMFVPDIMPTGTAKVVQNGTVSGILAPMDDGYLAINGFTIYNANNPSVYAVVAIASFTPGTTTTWTTSSPHKLAVGDIVRVYGLTSAPQFSGLAMTVTAVGSTTTFTTLLDSTGATTSVGSMQKISSNYLPAISLYYPELRVIAKITNANPMVITTLVAQNYAAGDVVTFDIASIFGVPQLSAQKTGLPVIGTVISANNAIGTQTVTIAIDSTNFGVFATNSDVTISNPGHWPLAPGFPFTFPYLVPFADGNINNLQAFGVTPSPLPYGNQDVLSFSRQNLGRNGIIIGAGDGTNSATTGGLISSTIDAWYWEALTVEQNNPY